MLVDVGVKGSLLSPVVGSRSYILSVVPGMGTRNGRAVANGTDMGKPSETVPFHDRQEWIVSRFCK